MSIIFNAEEIFNLAIQIEKNGAAFYKKAANNTKDANLKGVLNGLVTMEINHEKTFEDLKKGLLSSHKEQTTFDPYDELALYLKAFADGHVFDLSDPSASLTGNESGPAILKKAIGLEKDSIVLYIGLKDLVPKEFGQDKIDKIIAEEMGHIRLLSDQLRAIK
ncbi:MAG: ferritin family protein [Spirochaetales bacterium]|nr:ferritin family protein [Spirochaetales bacterium]